MKKTLIKILILLVVLSCSTANAVIAQKKSIHVESWEKRLNKFQPPEKIMDAIGLKPGMVIGEIGAGTGRMTVWLADRVGPSGKIYANDINKASLNSLKDRCKKYNINNIVTIVGETENPLLPEKSLDIAFMINVYHHLDKPVPLIKNIIPGLKPDGILAIVDADPEKFDSEGHSTPKEELNQAWY